MSIYKSRKNMLKGGKVNMKRKGKSNKGKIKKGKSKKGKSNKGIDNKPPPVLIKVSVFKGRCFGPCKSQKQMVNPQFKWNSNGSVRAFGPCESCKTNLNTFVSGKLFR